MKKGMPGAGGPPWPTDIEEEAKKRGEPASFVPSGFSSDAPAPITFASPTKTDALYTPTRRGTRGGIDNPDKLDMTTEQEPLADSTDTTPEPVAADALSAAADTTPETVDHTPKEAKATLASGVKKYEMHLLKEQELETEEVRVEYFTALEKYHKGRGAIGVTAENFIGELLVPDEIKKLRTRWVRARADHAYTQQRAFEMRMSETKTPRDEMLERLKVRAASGGEKGEKYAGQFDIKKRYERMVTLRSVVLGAEEAELAVKINALEKREKKSIDAVMEWYKKQPPALRIFGTSAAMLGIGVALGGSALALPVLASVAAAGSLRVLAEKLKNPELKGGLGKLAGVLTATGALGALADYGVQGLHKLAGTERKATELLDQKEGLGNLASVKNLKKLSSERKQALVAKETVQRHSRLARFATSIGAGWLLGHHASGGHTDTATTHEAVHANAHEVQTHANNHPSSTEHTIAHTSASAEHTPTHPAAAGRTAAETAPTLPAHPVTPSGELAGATIDTSGEGFGALIQQLKHNFHDQTVSGSHELSPALAHVLHSHPNDLSHELGVASDGSSLTMHEGDRLFTDNNQNVWFQPKGGEPVLAFENDPTAPGGFVHHAIHGHMQADAHAPTETNAAVTPERTPAVEHTPDVSAHPEPADHAAPDAHTGESYAPAPSDTTDVGTSMNQTEAPETATPPAPAPVPGAHEQAPAPENTTTAEDSTPHSSTEESTASSAHSPTEALSGSSFFNSHNVEITPAHPGVYLTPNASGGETAHMYGGAPGTAFEAAKQYVHDNPGTSVRFFDVNVDPLTGTASPVTGALISDSTGAFQPVFTDPATNAAFTPPDLDAVTRKLEFLYRPSA